MSDFEFIVNDESINCRTEKDGDKVTVHIGDNSYHLQKISDHLFALDIDGQRRTVAVLRHRETFYIDCDSIQIEVHEPSEEGFADSAESHAGEKDKLFAPMPGKIVKVMVAVGDSVTAKQPVAIVEAMKMENQVLAKADGKVKAVNFSAGDQVGTEIPIVELDLEE